MRAGLARIAVLDKRQRHADEGAERNEVRQPEASRETKVVAAQLSVSNDRNDRDEHHAVNRHQRVQGHRRDER